MTELLGYFKMFNSKVMTSFKNSIVSEGFVSEGRWLTKVAELRRQLRRGEGCVF